MHKKRPEEFEKLRNYIGKVIPDISLFNFIRKSSCGYLEIKIQRRNKNESKS
jgi:hypothetical protein